MVITLMSAASRVPLRLLCLVERAPMLSCPHVLVLQIAKHHQHCESRTRLLCRHWHDQNDEPRQQKHQLELDQGHSQIPAQQHHFAVPRLLERLQDLLVAVQSS